ncbi:SRPBCC family protein [Arsenophonus symbiont of Ornithomya chloropus]|uniref:SRPBCC family protein n=1 Tax=Arsenophonus symbiont of Ornithomya chloropus TaxID=634121 RepID=UPI0032B119F2
MSKITRSFFMSHSAKKIFHLVNDVNSYSLFLPYCTNSQILNYKKNEMIAAIDISQYNFSKTFVTHNTFEEYQSIHMKLIKGPLHQLIGHWFFRSLNKNSCKIEFYLEVEFINQFLEIFFAKVLHEVAEKILIAFSRRADEIYCNL